MTPPDQTLRNLDGVTASNPSKECKRQARPTQRGSYVGPGAAVFFAALFVIGALLIGALKLAGVV
jgi:hypothetical protein